MAPGFEVVCAIYGDLTGVARLLPPLRGLDGTYYEVKFDVVISFGGTQLEAYARWKEGVSSFSRDVLVLLIISALI